MHFHAAVLQIGLGQCPDGHVRRQFVRDVGDGFDLACGDGWLIPATGHYTLEVYGGAYDEGGRNARVFDANATGGVFEHHQVQGSVVVSDVSPETYGDFSGSVREGADLADRSDHTPGWIGQAATTQDDREYGSQRPTDRGRVRLSRAHELSDYLIGTFTLKI